ncbi:MAG: lipid A export permease/ATP-binding protein MsbA, partial [Gammaproteobacteria bacterium]
LSYVRPYWKVFMLSVLGMGFYAVTEPGLAALMRPLLDKGFARQDPTAIRVTAAALIGLFVIRGVSGFSYSYGMSWVGRHVIKTIRAQTFDQFLRLPALFYDRASSGVLVSKLTYNIEQIAESTTKAVTVLIKDTLTVIGLILWMFYLNPLLSLFVFIVGPVIGWLVRVVSRRYRRYSTRIQDSMGDVTQVAEEVISGHRVVKIFGGEDYERAHFERANEGNRAQNMKFAGTKAASIPLTQFIAGCGIAAIIMVATTPATIQKLSVGNFVSFLSAMLLIMAPLRRLTDINSTMQQGIAAANSVFQLLDEPAESDGGQRHLERARGDVEFDDVHFAYSDDKGDVLQGISFAAPAGQSVALVGRSGSGKSTLVSLLPRFYEIHCGHIRIDGHDIRDYDIRDLRRQIALVSQDVVLFNDTIAQNIAYGALSGTSREDIIEAARAAHALEFIEQLPEGLETVVGDRGIMLSGGQRQRIAIARALLKDAPILILDEATSALDTESERHIQAALEELMRDRTTFVIAHRLSTVENADVILVMDHGKIIETGTHSELLERDGAYAALHRMQFREPQKA